MVEYYKTNKGYYFKIIKNKKIRISKDEYSKNNKKKGGAHNLQSAQIPQYIVSNHIGWVIILHGKTISPGLSPHRQANQELPQLPLNVALYLYSPILDKLASSANKIKPILTSLCKAASNPNTNGTQMRSIADKGYNISKVEPGSFFYDMYLGGPHEWIPKESYGVFRCDQNGEYNPIQQLENPEEHTTLGHIINNILTLAPYYNHSIHIFSCRGKSKRDANIWDTYYNNHKKNKKYIMANSFNLPFRGELPNEYMPPGLKRGW